MAQGNDRRGGYDCTEHQWVDDGTRGRAHCGVCHEPRGSTVLAVLEAAGAPGGAWSVGRLLDTATTRRWTLEERLRGDVEERRRVFRYFMTSDHGRSREHIAEVHHGPDALAFAAAIVRAVNMFAVARKALRALLDDVSGGGGDEPSTVEFVPSLKAVQQARAALAAMEGQHGQSDPTTKETDNEND